MSGAAQFDRLGGGGARLEAMRRASMCVTSGLTFVRQLSVAATAGADRRFTTAG